MIFMQEYRFTPHALDEACGFLTFLPGARRCFLFLQYHLPGQYMFLPEPKSREAAFTCALRSTGEGLATFTKPVLWNGIKNTELWTGHGIQQGVPPHALTGLLYSPERVSPTWIGRIFSGPLLVRNRLLKL